MTFKESILNVLDRRCSRGGQMFNSRLRAVSLFSLSVEKNARDTQMTTRVTEGARRERLARVHSPY